ncbi:MAG: hypothetical protein RLZZ301_469 [Bacteroidota bacterium]|jgi:choice-of-anchor B domain-containing protein
MRYWATFFVFWLLSPSFAQQKNIQLLDHWFTDTLVTANSSQVRFSSCWGFTWDGKEYGVIGSTEGAHFFELSAADTFRFVDFVPGRFASAQAITREYKHYQHYVYASCDEGPSSLQIIDISTLPDSVHVVADLQDAWFGKSHNLFVDSANALLYLTLVTPIVNSIELSKVPMRVYSLQNPTQPQLLWEGPQDIPEVHDVYVRNNIAVLNCGFDGIRVYDFSNPSQPIYKSNLTVYPHQGYNHQGWLSPDGSTYVFADETAGLPLKKAEVLSNWNLQIVGYFQTENTPYPKTPHNVQLDAHFAFVSYYNDGLRIFDYTCQPVREVAYFDTYQDGPLTNNYSMWGAWGVHALLPSQRILISDRNNGFFLFRFNRALFETPAAADFTLYPNPSESGFSVRSPEDALTDFTVDLFDLNGKLLCSNRIKNQSVYGFEAPLANGVYVVRIHWMDEFGDMQFKHIRWEKIGS